MPAAQQNSIDQDKVDDRNFHTGLEYQASAGSDSTSRKSEFCFKAIVKFEVNSTSYDNIRL
jgi:hypothetical protein